MKLHLTKRVREVMLADAKNSLPNECCGLLVGSMWGCIGEVTGALPLENEAASPIAYNAESRSLLNAFRLIRYEGLELLGIYHSHPTSEPTPSRRDLAEWLYPDQVMVIIGMAGELPLVRGWIVKDGGIQETQIT